MEDKVDEIDGFLSQISGDVRSLVEDLDKAKKTISVIENSVKLRIENIKDEFKVIRRKIFNLKSLIFSALRADLGSVVMGSLRNIISEVDNIVEKDLGQVNSLVNQTFLQ